MNQFKNKKGIGVVMATLFMLLVAIVASTVAYNWFNQFQSDWNAKAELRDDIGKLELLGIKKYGNYSLIGVRNHGGAYHIIDRVLVDDVECSLLSTNVIDSLDEVYLNCPVVIGQNYAIELFTDKGITAKTLTANGEETYIASEAFEGTTETTLDYSLRFNDDDSAYLSWTPSTDEGDTWTWSGWVKRGNLGTGQTIFGRSGDNAGFGFRSVDDFYINDDGAIAYDSVEVYRDSSKWYHIVVNGDGSNNQIWIDGEEISISGSANLGNLNTNVEHRIAYDAGGYGYFDGYLNNIHFIDGQALNATSFGEFNSNGKWIPKDYTGTYGTNGFKLDFSNVDSLGADSSGNVNFWTLNNIDSTDQVLDTPTNNFAVANPLDKTSSQVLANGNLLLDGASGVYRSTRFSIAIPQTGKWYWEAKLTGSINSHFGIATIKNTLAVDTVTSGEARHYTQTGLKYNGSSTAYGDTWVSGDNFSVLVDMDVGNISFYRNGVDLGVAYSDLAGEEWFPHFYLNNNDFELNFGQGGQSGLTYYSNAGGYFKYEPPSGFKALSTANLPVSSIQVPEDYFDILNYTGNGGNQNITGLSFSPDLVWAKNRDALDAHFIHDTVRGPTNWLVSNLNFAQTTQNVLTNFLTNGFEVGTQANGLNTNSQNYIAWNWLESATSGFDIVNFTGNAVVGRAISHSVGNTPEMVIVKRINGTGSWSVWHEDFGTATDTDYILLESIGAKNSAGAADNWDDTVPNSTHFTVSTTTNEDGTGHIAYLFSEVEGYSKFGSYTGNGNADGPFIYTGFKPKYVVTKRTDSTSRWLVVDSIRSEYNPRSDALDHSDTLVEGQHTFIDFLSNGFKLRTADLAVNANGGSYIYIAFSEQPFN